MPERTYTGFAPRGEVQIPDDAHGVARRVPFTRGVPVEFEAGEVKYLDDDWVTPKSKAAKAAPNPEEPSDG